MPKARFILIATSVGLVTLGAIWAGMRLFHTHANAPRTASTTPQSPPAVSPPPVVQTPKPGVTAPVPAVLHQEIPDVSRSARGSIRGVIKISVRVIIDRSGDVVAAILDNRPSSKYFARAAMDAAKKWKFAEAAEEDSRVWVLHFEFSRAGTTARAAAVQ